MPLLSPLASASPSASSLRLALTSLRVCFFKLFFFLPACFDLFSSHHFPFIDVLLCCYRGYSGCHRSIPPWLLSQARPFSCVFNHNSRTAGVHDISSRRTLCGSYHVPVALFVPPLHQLALSPSPRFIPFLYQHKE